MKFSCIYYNCAIWFRLIEIQLILYYLLFFLVFYVFQSEFYSLLDNSYYNLFLLPKLLFIIFFDFSPRSLFYSVLTLFGVDFFFYYIIKVYVVCGKSESCKVDRLLCYLHTHTKTQKCTYTCLFYTRNKR